MLFKRIMGFVLLTAFIGFMGYKLILDAAHIEDGGLFIAFVVVIVLMIVMVVRKIIYDS